MTKKFLTSMFCIMAISATSASFADVAPYVALRAGLGHSSIDGSDANPSGGVFGAAVGAKYAFTPNFSIRGELEYSYDIFSDSYSEGDSSLPGGDQTNSTLDLDMSTYLANFYADWTEYKIKPYAGISLGMMKINKEYKESYHAYGMSESIDDKSEFSKSVFTWGIGAGFGFNFTESFGADVGIRYMFATVESIDMNVFTGTLGLRYTF